MKYNHEIELILQNLGASALKRYGQNFLVDQSIIQLIVEQARIVKGNKIIEIGPGLGALTSVILNHEVQYTSFEIDQSFHRYLEQKYPQGQHHRLNFLKAQASQVDTIIGNLPYYVTTEIIEKIYKDFAHVSRIVLMVQKEVFPRIIAQPGDLVYGPLAIYLATLGVIQSVKEVPPTAFFPEPHVNSIIFTITAFPDGPRVATKPFFYFIKKLFLHRRKTILNNLSGMLGSRDLAKTYLSQSNIHELARPEMISVDDYLKLFGNIPEASNYNN
jgi:16S rRNA (adenine1518-N6/adenine1519-N6)-dimethyltransferase